MAHAMIANNMEKSLTEENMDTEGVVQQNMLDKVFVAHTIFQLNKEFISVAVDIKEDSQVSLGQDGDVNKRDVKTTTQFF